MNNPPQEVLRYGATPAEWDWAAYQFGADLLPSVGNPVFKVSPKSTLKDHKTLAKTPSITGSHGVSFGIMGWTAHHATPELVANWRSDADLNILLITRNVRAIDIDIEDQARADSLENYIVSQLGLTSAPVRYRENSGKRTILVRVEPQTHIRKRVVKIANTGMIEFLAMGQQTALFGTHPSGARYQIRGHEQGIPTVSLDAMTGVWDALRSGYDPESKPFFDADEQAGEFIVRNSGALANDPVLKYLEGEGLVVGYTASGIANIICPNAAAHTTDTGPNSTSWLPAGMGGKKQGGFSCRHGHCEHITTPIFLNMIGFQKQEAEDVFAEVSQPNPLTVLAQSDEPKGVLQYKLTEAEFSLLGVGFILNKKGTELELGQANINHICRAQSDFVNVKRDTFKEELLIKGGNATVWKPVTDDTITELREAIQRRYKLRPSAADVSAALSAAGAAHNFDSATEWLAQQKHDGIKRVEFLARDILGAQDEAYATALSNYLMVGLVARTLSPGVKLDMVPILVSPKQGTGKSSLVRALAPFDEWFGEMDLAVRDEDASRLLRGKSIIELPELKGLNSRDSESIKAWITKQIETWTPKYKEMAIQYPRRCLMVATDNRQRFLSDPSGNRRWLPIRVAITQRFINHPYVSANVGQYWAEARDMTLAFETVHAAVQHYSKTVDALAEPARLAATILDEHFDEARDFLAIQRPGAPVTINALKAQLRMTGAFDNFRAYSILRMLGWEQVDGSNKWIRPPADTNFTL